MNIQIGNAEALLSAMEYSDNEIVFLIGSPLSCTYKNITGIPSVKGMLDIIEEKVSEKQKTLTAYHAAIDTIQADTEKYQQSFNFLSQYTSPNTVNGIIRKATLQAYIGDTSKVNINDVTELSKLQEIENAWSLPPATEALATYLTKSQRVSKTVLTPNFDPLLSIALTKLGHTPTRTVLHGDSNIEQFQSPNINIVHFHGYWLDTDTLHTPAQLTLDRPQLKQSLARVLNNKTLVVIGYGGWDDVFTQVLFSLMSDNGANFDILWSFYETNEDIIKNKYSTLLNSVTPALQRGRFKIYGGINCHEFLPEAVNELSEPVTLSAKVQNLDLCLPNIDIDAAFKELDSGPMLSQWQLSIEKSHNYIRCTERSYLLRQLNEYKFVNITAEWGISHDEFIYSLTTDTLSPYLNAPIYKIDLNNVKSKDEVLERIEQETGMQMQVFIQKLPKVKNIIYFENVGEGLILANELYSFTADLIKLLSIIDEYKNHSRVILLSRIKLSDELNPISLKKLEDDDAKLFVQNHSSVTSPLDKNSIDTIIDIAGGVPSSIEKCIQDLRLLSTDALYEEHYTPESHKYDNEKSFHIEIIKRVEMLASSQELHTKRSYQLLETLAILEHGDTFDNLRKTNPEINYQKSNLDQLYNLGLIEPVNIIHTVVKVSQHSGGNKLVKLPAAVRNYVYSKLTLKTVYEISKNIAKVHLGQNWQTGTIQLCQLTKQLIKETDKVAGSTQVLLAQLLKCSIELDIGRDIDASFRACRIYGKEILSANRYKNLILFTKQIKAIVKESDKIESLAYFNLLEGVSYRMIKKYDLAESLILNALDDTKGLSKTERNIGNINLMFLYDTRSKPNMAIEYAKKALKIDPRNSDAKMMLEELTAENSIPKLKALEKKFRSIGRIRTSNQAAIKLSKLEISSTQKSYWLDRVLLSNDTQYNKIRAAMIKFTIKDNQDNKTLDLVLNLLHKGYILSFSQGINSMFNVCHNLLWDYYLSINNYSTLFNLYRHSSLYWRINEDIERESSYSKYIQSLLEGLVTESIDILASENAYVIHRAQQLTQNND